MGVPLLACLLICTFLAQATNTAAETVKVSTIPVFPQIPRGQTSRDFHVLVRVEAPSAAEKRRVPIDLVAVLDVGDRTRLDLVKEAMKFVIRQLHDDDRLAIVGPYTRQLGKEKYSTKLTDVSGDGRSNAQKKVDQLEARGDAKSTSGWEEAIKILEEQPVSSNSRASFIILVTDGEDIRRFKNLPREFSAALRKHPVHTFGIGASHDPKALLSIAEESLGTYSFVDDQNLNKITGALAVCLGGLKTVVAVGTRVSLKAAEGSRVKIEKIESGGYNKSPISDGQTAADVAIGVLYAGEVKSFIVHLHVPAPASLEGGCEQQQLLTASFHHYGSDSNTPPIQAVLLVQRPPQQAVAMLQKVPIPMVVNHIVQFTVLDMVANFVETEIWPLVPNPITFEEGNALGSKLQLLWDQFMHAHQFWSGLDLGGLESEVNAMVITLQRQAGGLRSFSMVSYIFSWMSSYQMQRPTTMGSPHNIVARFITLDMQVTLQQVAININSGCLECKKCKDKPPPVLLPSGCGVNQAMNQTYLACHVSFICKGVLAFTIITLGSLLLTAVVLVCCYCYYRSDPPPRVPDSEPPRSPGGGGGAHDHEERRPPPPSPPSQAVSDRPPPASLSLPPGPAPPKPGHPASSASLSLAPACVASSPHIPSVGGAAAQPSTAFPSLASALVVSGPLCALEERHPLSSPPSSTVFSPTPLTHGWLPSHRLPPFYCYWPPASLTVVLLHPPWLPQASMPRPVAAFPSLALSASLCCTYIGPPSCAHSAWPSLRLPLRRPAPPPRLLCSAASPSLLHAVAVLYRRLRRGTDQVAARRSMARCGFIISSGASLTRQWLPLSRTVVMVATRTLTHDVTPLIPNTPFHPGLRSKHLNEEDKSTQGSSASLRWYLSLRDCSSASVDLSL